MKKWTVITKRKTKRSLLKLPKKIQETYDALVIDLAMKGLNPGKRWQNYSKLGKGKHHCHLTYSYVACWEESAEGIKIMEVYYVGSRENAPY